jgi:hypothetical protein
MNVDDIDSPEISRTTEVGRSLLEFAKEADFSARRGVVADLYPYIVAASKRMSARAIARYLEEQHDVKVSAVTVAKAIRNPKKYWMFFFDTIEPYARRIQEGHNVAMESFLFDYDVFEHFCHTDEQPKHLVANNAEELEAAFDDYAEAVTIIEEKWFGLDDEIRRDAQAYLANQLEEFNKVVDEDEHEESK